MCANDLSKQADHIPKHHIFYRLTNPSAEAQGCLTNRSLQRRRVPYFVQIRKKRHHTNAIYRMCARRTEDTDGGTRTNSNVWRARYRILVGRRHDAVHNGPAQIAAGKFGRHATAAVPRAPKAEFGLSLSAKSSAIGFRKSLSTKNRLNVELRHRH